MTIKMLEVTEEEMNKIIKAREQKAKEEKIQVLANQLRETLNELHKLNACVLAQNKTRYASVSGDPVSSVTCNGSIVRLYCG